MIPLVFIEYLLCGVHWTIPWEYNGKGKAMLFYEIIVKNINHGLVLPFLINNTFYAQKKFISVTITEIRMSLLTAVFFFMLTVLYILRFLNSFLNQLY